MTDKKTECSSIPEITRAEQFDEEIGFGGRLWSFFKCVGQGVLGGLAKLTSIIPFCGLFDSYNKFADNMLRSASMNLTIATGEQYWAKDLVQNLGRENIVSNTNEFFDDCSRGNEKFRNGEYGAAVGTYAEAGASMVGGFLKNTVAKPVDALWSVASGVVKRGTGNAEEATARERRDVAIRSYYANTGKFPTDEQIKDLVNLYAGVQWFRNYNNGRNPNPEELRKLKINPDFYIEHKRFATTGEAKRELQKESTQQGVGLSAQFHQSGQDISVEPSGQSVPLERGGQMRA